MRNLLLYFLLLCPLAQAQLSRTCSDSPQAVTSFNSDWYYSEFQIPDNYKVVSLYGGFERPGYIPAHYDYIAQFYKPGQEITSLGDYQLFNYDLIDDPLYNIEYNVENLNLLGEGTIRISVPITHGVIWEDACVTIEELPTPESVPEPSSIGIFALGSIVLIAGISIRQKKKIRLQ